ncbi:undecaprenyl-phosphate glucose phosphotransferase [Colwellia sp. E2M01]|uniref:undecaprenyl-phosphate glucose phosphotransferase n=1 Tax=Colwellia sp. E2M01 TaxID=2841561 RepID=UPI001C097630|nr:undecaprenyl-phosphate glucose phosphotransferase [Colwellia sp. E2M01]MBU2870029.1 undecaprenyl-phosphate glucose phosphotransferase [Colwellia sp. E2M01]
MLSSNGFIKNNINKFATFYRLVDVAIIQLSLFIAITLCHSHFSKDLFLLSLIAIIGFSVFAEMFALYRSWRDGFFKEIIFNATLSWTVAFSLILVYVFFSQATVEYPRMVIALWYVITGALLFTWRLSFGLFLRNIRRKGINIRSVAIIGITKEGERLAKQILEHPETGFRLQAVFDDRDESRLPEGFHGNFQGTLNEGVERAKRNEFDVIYIAVPLTAEDRITEILHLLGDTTVNVQLVPNLFMFSMMSASMAQVGDIQTISVYCNPMRGTYALIKRIEDIVLSSIILTIIAIPLMIIAIAVKTTSKGPIIFKQDRYGLNGKRIKVWKFRSMTVTENTDVVTQATKNDVRITPLGAFLRRTSLDELPQFINVLQGGMSVVGPRPHAVAHNEQYRKAVDYYMLRHKIKPGITGWAQINGWRGETDTIDKMEMRIKYDLDYIRRWSLWFDVKIVFYTIFRSFTDKNAY